MTKEKEYSFLFGFVNLPFQEGKLSPFRPARKLKRTPTKPPEDLTPFTKEQIRDGHYALTKGHNGEVHLWDVTKKSNPVYIGVNYSYPALNKFKSLCERHKVTEDVSRASTLHVVWEHCVDILKALASNDRKSLRDWGGVLHELYQDNIPKWIKKLSPPTPVHDNTFPLIAYAELLKFVNSEKASRLMQCSRCGSFWIKEKARPKKFCSKKCESKDNAPTHHDDLMNKRLKRTKDRETDKPKILKYLMEHYSFQRKSGDRWVCPNTKEAEEIYNKISKRITASYDYFIKKWAEPKGYV